MGELAGQAEKPLGSAREAIAQLVRATAQQHGGDGLALLSLLRLLEQLHQEVREGLFQEALPQNRQALYAMLRDMESEGGWPYIGRGSLRSLLEHFPEIREDLGFSEEA